MEDDYGDEDDAISSGREKHQVASSVAHDQASSIRLPAFEAAKAKVMARLRRSVPSTQSPFSITGARGSNQMLEDDDEECDHRQRQPAAGTVPTACSLMTSPGNCMTARSINTRTHDHHHHQSLPQLRRGTHPSPQTDLILPQHLAASSPSTPSSSHFRPSHIRRRPRQSSVPPLLCQSNNEASVAGLHQALQSYNTLAALNLANLSVTTTPRSREGVATANALSPPPPLQLLSRPAAAAESLASTCPTSLSNERSSSSTPELDADNDDDDDDDEEEEEEGRIGEGTMSEGEVLQEDDNDRALQLQLPAGSTSIVPISPNALIQHLSTVMVYRTKRLESGILPRHVGELVVAQGSPQPVSDLVQFYLAIFRELNDQEEDGAEEENGREEGEVGVASLHGYQPSPLRSRFNWPVFEMVGEVEFEFGGEADGITLEHVLIVSNLPLIMTTAPTNDDEEAINSRSSSTSLSPLLRAMLEKAGTVRTVILKRQSPTLLEPSPVVLSFPSEEGNNNNDRGQQEPELSNSSNNNSSSSSSRGSTLAFLEMDSEEEVMQAVKFLDSFPWSLNRLLQARRFRDYGREEAGQKNGEEEGEEEEGQRSTSTGPSSLLSARSGGEESIKGVMMTDDEGSETSRSAFYLPPPSISSSNGRPNTAASSSQSDGEEPCSSSRQSREVEQLLDVLRGPDSASNIRRLDEQLVISIRQKDVNRIKTLEKGLLKAYLDPLLDLNMGGEGGGGTKAEDDMDAGMMRRELEMAITRLFEEEKNAGGKRGGAVKKGRNSEGGSGSEAIWSKCCMAERLRSGELLRRLRTAESWHVYLLREVRQNHNTVNLLQSQRAGMLHHIRQIRQVNHGLSSRNQKLITRLQTHQQVLSRMELLQERLTECEERMAKASIANSQMMDNRRRYWQTTDDEDEIEEGKGGECFDVNRLAREAEKTTCATNLEDLGASERALDLALQRIRQKRQEKIREEQIKLMREKEMEDAQKHCCICQDHAKSVLLLPCRHLCVCNVCGDRVELTRCPVCREEIEERMTVYA